MDSSEWSEVNGMNGRLAGWRHDDDDVQTDVFARCEMLWATWVGGHLRHVSASRRRRNNDENRPTGECSGQMSRPSRLETLSRRQSSSDR